MLTRQYAAKVNESLGPVHSVIARAGVVTKRQVIAHLPVEAKDDRIGFVCCCIPPHNHWVESKPNLWKEKIPTGYFQSLGWPPERKHDFYFAVRHIVDSTIDWPSLQSGWNIPWPTLTCN